MPTKQPGRGRSIIWSNSLDSIGQCYNRWSIFMPRMSVGAGVKSIGRGGETSAILERFIRRASIFTRQGPAFMICMGRSYLHGNDRLLCSLRRIIISRNYGRVPGRMETPSCLLRQVQSRQLLLKHHGNASSMRLNMGSPLEKHSP